MTQTSSTISRNAPCPCGSGQKYKHCCLGRPVAESRTKLKVLLLLAYALAVSLGFAVAMLSRPQSGVLVGLVGVVAVTGIWVLAHAPRHRGRVGADRLDFGRGS